MILRSNAPLKIETLETEFCCWHFRIARLSLSASLRTVHKNICVLRFCRYASEPALSGQKKKRNKWYIQKHICKTSKSYHSEKVVQLVCLVWWRLWMIAGGVTVVHDKDINCAEWLQLSSPRPICAWKCTSSDCYFQSA